MLLLSLLDPILLIRLCALAAAAYAFGLLDVLLWWKLRSVARAELGVAVTIRSASLRLRFSSRGVHALVAVRGVAVPDYAGFGSAPMLTVAEVDAEVAPRVRSMDDAASTRAKTGSSARLRSLEQVQKGSAGTI